MPVPLIIPAIAGASALAKGVGGIIQQTKAQKALKELAKTPPPEYSVSPELQGAYQRAQAMSQYGFAPEEKAQFQGQLARSQAGQRQSALDLSGGSMGGAIGSVLQAQQTGAITDFAAKGAGLKRENIRYADTLASQVQSQQNLIQQQRIARRQMLEQAYGQASAQGTENMFGALTDISNIGIASMGSGIGKGARVAKAGVGARAGTEVSGLTSAPGSFDWSTPEQTQYQQTQPYNIKTTSYD